MRPLLSNYPHIHSIGFGYIASDWAAWVARGEAPAIKPVRELLLAARRLGLDVFLITRSRGARRTLPPPRRICAARAWAITRV